MSRSGLFTTQTVFFNRSGQTVSVTRDTRFGVGRTEPATQDTRVRLVVLVYCQARATPKDRLRPNTARTVDYRGRSRSLAHLSYKEIGEEMSRPEETTDRCKTFVM
jgi:hypothetical protein